MFLGQPNKPWLSAGPNHFVGGVVFTGVFSSFWARIFFFAVLSHYILDMVTVQGVPLFYPWLRNPCVIPGNPDFRMRTNDYKAEAKAFLVFAVIGVCCIPLFEHGFWTAYNRGFGTLKHIHTERLNSKTQVMVDYNFSMNGKEFIGEGTLVDSKQQWALISDEGKLYELDRNNPAQVIHSVKPKRTQTPYLIKELTFESISLDSLNNMLRPIIATGEINSTQQVQWREQGILVQGKSIKLDHKVAFQVSKVVEDGLSNLNKQLAVLEARSQRERASFTIGYAQLRKDKSELNSIKSQLLQENDMYNISSL
ncbi:metal-dependent hydrolase [Fibrobacterales bacterium]|nr:metal-dependent hydrolase [Fibrobacterales bacterium]